MEGRIRRLRICGKAAGDQDGLRVAPAFRGPFESFRASLTFSTPPRCPIKARKSGTQEPASGAGTIGLNTHDAGHSSRTL